MKITKVLTILVLCLAILVSLAACKNKNKGEDPSAPADIYAIANSSTATTITTSIGYTAADGATFNGWYVAQRQDNDMIIDYEFKRYQTIEESIESGDTNRFVNEAGTVYYLDGKYYNSYDESKTPWVDAPMDANFKFNLSKDKLSNIITPSENVLYASMTPEACKDMFGLDISCPGSISLYLMTNGVQLTEIQFVYTTDSGAVVTIFTTYSYNDLELDFTPITGEPEEEA